MYKIGDLVYVDFGEKRKIVKVQTRESEEDRNIAYLTEGSNSWYDEHRVASTRQEFAIKNIRIHKLLDRLLDKIEKIHIEYTKDKHLIWTENPDFGPFDFTSDEYQIKKVLVNLVIKGNIDLGL